MSPRSNSEARKVVPTAKSCVAFAASVISVIVLVVFQQRVVRIAAKFGDFNADLVHMLPAVTTREPGVAKHALCARMPLGGGRLGNYMFVHAATLGIAYSLNCTPLIHVNNNPLPSVFKIATERVNGRSRTKWKHFAERDASRFDLRVRSLRGDVDHDLKGFFQSWKYFADPEIQKKIREEFTFQDAILARAKAFLLNATKSYWMAKNQSRDLSGIPSGTNDTQSQLKLVGIHVRMGDLIRSPAKSLGYRTAPASYLRKAIGYFERRYNGTRLMFVLCSDSMAWAKDNVKSRQHPVVFSEGGQAAVDLAILSLCTDIVMTVGTFGWWAAWLADGITLYWNEWPKQPSKIAKHFLADDYYPPHWIGMSA